jgi:hypothetical protein
MVFVKSEFTATNLVISLKMFYHMFVHKGSLTVPYFDLSQAFNDIPHTLSLDKLNIFKLSYFTSSGSKATYQLHLPYFVP